MVLCVVVVVENSVALAATVYFGSVFGATQLWPLIYTAPLLAYSPILLWAFLVYRQRDRNSPIKHGFFVFDDRAFDGNVNLEEVSAEGRIRKAKAESHI